MKLQSSAKPIAILPSISEEEPANHPVTKTRSRWRTQQGMTDLRRVPSFRAIEVTKIIKAAETLTAMRIDSHDND